MAAAAPLFGALAVYSPKYALGGLAFAALMALAFWRLAAGVAVFTVLTFPAHLPGSIGVGATVAKPLGIVLILAWLAVIGGRRASAQLITRDRPTLFWVVTTFVVFAAASALWATDVTQTRFQLSRLVQVALFMFVVYTAASTAASFRTVVWGYLAGSVVAAVYSIATNSYGQTNGRLSGIFDPNYFAAALIPAIIVSCYLVLTSVSRRTRLVGLAVFGIDCVAFALTQSRGGIAGLAVAFLVAIVFAGRARPRIVVVVLGVLAVGLIYYVVARPAHLAGSFSGTLASASSGRSDEWKIALRMLADHPAGGVGLGNYVVLEPSYATHSFNLNFAPIVVSDPRVAHSAYLQIAAELGLVGLALFVAIIVLVILMSARALPSFASHASGLEFYSRGLVSGAIGMFVAYAFLTAEYEKQLWLVLGMLASTPALAKRAAQGDRERARAMR